MAKKKNTKSSKKKSSSKLLYLILIIVVALVCWFHEAILSFGFGSDKQEKVVVDKIDAIEVDLYSRTFELDVELAKKMQIYNFIEMISDISDVIENIPDKIQIMLVTRKA